MDIERAVRRAKPVSAERAAELGEPVADERAVKVEETRGKGASRTWGDARGA